MHNIKPKITSATLFKIILYKKNYIIAVGAHKPTTCLLILTEANKWFYNIDVYLKTSLYAVHESIYVDMQIHWVYKTLLCYKIYKWFVMKF